MSPQSTVIAYEPLKSIDSATLTGTYMPIGSPSTHGARIFKIVNDSTTTVTISTDGVTDEDVLPATTFVLYDICTNRTLPTSEFVLPPTQFYAKGTAGTGLVYVVILYGNDPNKP